MHRLALVLVLSAGAALPQDVKALLRTMDELVPKESLSNGIETELRAAFMLHDSYPKEAAALLARGKARLAAHPELVPTKWMIASLYSLEPDRAEEIILQHPKPAVFRFLVEHYVTRNQPEKAVSLLKQAIRHDGAPFPQVGVALEKLVPIDPMGAAEVYFTMRESPGIASKYALPISRAPVIFSRELALAARKHPGAVRNVLVRLLPLFIDEKFLMNVPDVVSMKAVIGGQEVETKNARETVLLRLGALSKAVAPDLYKQYEALFDSRVASVNGLEGALAVAEAPTQRNQAQARFDFGSAPLDSALAEWRKKTELNDRLGAAGTLIGRPDLEMAQKKRIMDEFLTSLRTDAKTVHADVPDSLIWYATKGGLDEPSIRPAVELLARSIPHSPGYLIDDHSTAMVRDYGIPLGPNDASLQVRIALLGFEQAQGGRYSFTLPSLDGKAVTLKELRGKVVLLNFWATWCGPCRGEKPILEKVYRDLKDKGFIVLAITDEDPGVVQGFAKQFKIGIPILIDRARATFDHYSIQGLPKTIILDRQGKAVAWPILISDELALRKTLASAGVAP